MAMTKAKTGDHTALIAITTARTMMGITYTSISFGLPVSSAYPVYERFSPRIASRRWSTPTGSACSSA